MMNGLFGEHTLSECLPRMLTGEELVGKMEYLPPYSQGVRSQSKENRLMALNDIYRIYIPNAMSTEIYSKLYLAMLRSLQKKGSKTAISQQYRNHFQDQNTDTKGIIGGSDCFTIIGTSGIGKSATISRSVKLLSEKGIMEWESPHLKVAPCVIVQCPFDCSVKGLLLEILRVLDEQIGTNHFEKAMRARTTADMMISSVSQILLNHVGILIVDEIQNIVYHRNGRQLVSMLTQLINSSGISICMVGTPEAEPFFSSVDYLARRTLGLRYSPFEYGEYFEQFCRTLFGYQYVKETAVLTDKMLDWFYEHSNGTLALVVSVFHDAQEMAILNGKECISLEMLGEAYNQRMNMIQGFLQMGAIKRPQTSRTKKKGLVLTPEAGPDKEKVNLYDLVMRARENKEDVVKVLKKHIKVEEVLAE